MKPSELKKFDVYKTIGTDWLHLNLGGIYNKKYKQVQYWSLFFAGDKIGVGFILEDSDIEIQKIDKKYFIEKIFTINGNISRVIEILNKVKKD